MRFSWLLETHHEGHTRSMQLLPALLQAQGIAPLLLQGSPAAPSQSLNTSKASCDLIELEDSDEEERSGRPAKRARLMSSPHAETSVTTRVKAPASDDEDDVDLLKVGHQVPFARDSVGRSVEPCYAHINRVRCSIFRRG